jgi:hypothetical protein
MGTKREATLVLASGLVCAIVASSATFTSLKSGVTSDVTLAHDMAEIERLHRRDVFSLPY